MKVKYIGMDGSMGYKTGETYIVSLKTSGKYILLCCEGHKICPYSSLNALLKNWEEQE